MRERYTTVDYALRKKRLLQQVASGLISTSEVCDASPYLANAARFHGEDLARRCPICRRSRLRMVHYVFGDDLSSASGSARSKRELRILAESYPEFDVFAVEVCRECSWNHLIYQFRLGFNVQDFKVTESVESPPGATGLTRRPAGTTTTGPDVNHNNVNPTSSGQLTRLGADPQNRTGGTSCDVDG
ncbi:DUF5318 family protein [Natronoglycomyces albus]|uniref:DUF5318 family protein n=1 Tax=Natronoglycomyces albus TaxID=2811108 RepID=A0A895XS17_9ACTN|nr:DUF5318 family protein [Natronoglycomyces albus]QSB05356.1 DUF5318 family protein [Natronoglycomyces albus]